MRFTGSLRSALVAVLCLSAGALAQGLPPALEADRLLQIAAAEMDKGPQADWPRVVAALKGAEATGEPMSTNFDYHYGRALHAAGQHADAAQRLERYLRTHGKKARDYSEAMFSANAISPGGWSEAARRWKPSARRGSSETG